MSEEEIKSKKIIISYGYHMSKKDIYDYCDKYLDPINPDSKTHYIKQVYDNFYSIGLLVFHMGSKYIITHPEVIVTEAEKDFDRTFNVDIIEPEFKNMMLLMKVINGLHYDEKVLLDKKNPELKENKEALKKIQNKTCQVPQPLIFTYHPKKFEIYKISDIRFKSFWKNRTSPQPEIVFDN